MLGTACAADQGALTAGSLRCDALVNPIGMDDPKPLLSWTLACDERGAMQKAYQIIVASTKQLADGGTGDLWDSGKVVSGEQNQIEYAGKPLASRQPCFWRLKAWNAADQAGPWSDVASWETGLPDAADWHAKWIEDPKSFSQQILVIDKATYDSVDEPAGQPAVGKDVTDIVRGEVKAGKLDIVVKNDSLGGDPALNKHKALHLRYHLGDAPPIEETFKEGTGVNIPPRSPQYLRKAFSVAKPIVRARLYATALGLYEFTINGQRAGDHVLAPDWTDYRKRVRYQAYDVTNLIKAGDNAIAGMVADGWYCGHIGNGGYRFWGTTPCVMAQLELTHEDGSIDTVCTDESWHGGEGPVLSSDIMEGEAFDARREFFASNAAMKEEDDAWKPVTIRTDGLPPEIDWQRDEPVRELMTLKPKTMSEPAAGHWVFDLGQNMVGLPRIHIAAAAGTTVTIRFAEMLNPDKSIYTTNYRGARSTDTYICRGGDEETWQPRFTFHGFRYIELSGLPNPPTLDSVEGIVIGSDTPSTGTFTCSDPQMNQLWSNIRWGQRGNFLSVPTDCPQRDERLGWMGDAQVFVGTAVYNANVDAFFNKWLVDVDDEQTAEGQFTDTSPELGHGKFGTPAWADAGVICPWTIYRTYGDRRELARNLPNMKRWVDWCEAHSTGLIRDHDRGHDYGDWLAIGANTSKELLGTAYFAHAADLVAQASQACGDDASAAKYGDLFKRIRDAFDAKYVSTDGHVFGDTQTAYAMALTFNLLPEKLRPAAAQFLADDVKAKGNHLSTGFVGVSYLLPTLTENGHGDVAFDLLMQDTFPSWLFSVKHGATTIWERWDGWTPEKGFQTPSMNSFNHYSLGSCGQWLYSTVAGISQPTDSVGYQKLVIRPHVGGGLSSVSAEYDSIRGPIKSAWKVQSDRFTLDVTVPANVTARVEIPTRDAASVQESGKPVKAADARDGSATVEIGSGIYHFEATLK